MPKGRGAGPGRPYIGQKVQTHVPDPVKEWVKEEAKRQGIAEAEVSRRIFLAGLAAVGAAYDPERGVIVSA